MSVLYSPEERKKLEWAIGAIVTGDSKNIQKFEVLYGPPGSGKSTVLNLIQNCSMAITRYSMQKRWEILIMRLRWNLLNKTHWLLFSTMEI